MNSRSENLQEIRPLIKAAKVNETMTANEKFQNKTLRPIIKLQHELLILVFKNYILKYKSTFTELPLEKKLDYIENAIQKNIKFRTLIIGLIIGHLTVEEYTLYTQNTSALNKRIINMVKERYIASLQLFN